MKCLLSFVRAIAVFKSFLPQNIMEKDILDDQSLNNLHYNAKPFFSSPLSISVS